MPINKINNINAYKVYQNAGFRVPNNIDIFKNYACQNKTKKQVNKKAFIFIAPLALLGIIAAAIYKKNDLISQIKKGMELELHEKINKKALSCIINRKQLTKMLSELSEENFVASQVNVENGIFRADLHSHTCFSDGWGLIENIMDEVSKYADKLHSKTGKKFLFSITDHDGVDGVKEALKIIVKNPEKFKNIAFVPGVELSFIQHIENGKFEGAELLAHCINPYSKKLNSFLNNLHNSRGKMIQNAIDCANEKLGKNCFSREEMDEYYLKKPNENFVYNLHYRVLNYLQVKNLINKIASEKKLDAGVLYSKYMNKWQINKNFKSIDNFIKFLEQERIIVKKPDDNDLIYKICQDSFPKIENNQIKSQSESTFEELINLFSKDKNAILGFAHPVFTFKSFKNKEKAIDSLILKSKNLIKTTEKYHQAYYYPIKNSVISQNDVDEINGLIDKYNLINIGGRDNHSPHFLNSAFL